MPQSIATCKALKNEEKFLNKSMQDMFELFIVNLNFGKYSKARQRILQAKPKKTTRQ